MHARSAKPGAVRGKAKCCIILFLMGGPPQHSTWDPKPDVAAEIRGEFGPIATNVPGSRRLNDAETAPNADKLCVVRAVSTGDNAHSSSGYYMLTGRPASADEATKTPTPVRAQRRPNMGAIVRRVRGDSGGRMPSAVAIARCTSSNTPTPPSGRGRTPGFLSRQGPGGPSAATRGAASLRIAEFTLRS